ncbi:MULTISPECIES: hypothetical protein [Streptomyces]|uniref:hypothetical protein n=1 Tax=Streptomyces TaxID=1883 RepID=UPI00345B4D6A
MKKSNATQEAYRKHETTVNQVWIRKANLPDWKEQLADMSQPAEHVIEEGEGEDEGRSREFWVRTVADGHRYTLSFEASPRGVEVLWYVDSPEEFDGFEASFSMEITRQDARHLLAVVEREIGPGQ